MITVLSLCLVCFHFSNGMADEGNGEHISSHISDDFQDQRTLEKIKMSSEDIIPLHYDLRVIYDVDPASNFSFFGYVVIHLMPTTSVKFIAFNTTGIYIAKHKMELTVPLKHDSNIPMADALGTLSSEATKVEIKRVMPLGREMYHVEFDKELQVDKTYLLTVPFSGTLQKWEVKNRGVIFNSYFNKNTRSKEYYLVTDFSSPSSVFPCFADSAARSTFSIAVGHHEDYHALSNMPRARISNDNAIESIWSWDADIEKMFGKQKESFVWDYFETTPSIRLYSVAFMVSKFKQKKCQDFSETKISIWSRPDVHDQTSYAANMAPKIWLNFIRSKQWFHVNRTKLPKIDLVATHGFADITEGFWGLFFIWEPYVLTVKHEEFPVIAYVLSVKLASHFFGHTVSMRHRNQSAVTAGCSLFLAELTTLAVLPSYPTVHVDTFFVQKLKEVHIADALDWSESSGSTMLDAQSIDMEFEVFYYYGMSKDKMAILLRMLHICIGEQAFIEALRKTVFSGFHKKYSFSNTEPDYLWELMQQAGVKYKSLSSLNETLDRVMMSWTQQPGYPLLTVERDYVKSMFNITQKRYYALTSRPEPRAGPTLEQEFSWWIPMLISTKIGFMDLVKWLRDDEGVTEPRQFYSFANENDWFLLNPHSMALCRVNYDDHNWKLLIELLLHGDFSVIPMVARVQLLSDAFELARTGHLNYTLALQLSTYLYREQDYQPLHIGLEGLNTIGNLLQQTQDYSVYTNFILGLIEKRYHTVRDMVAGQISSPNLLKLEQYISEWACRMNVQACESKLMEMFYRLMITENPDENNFISPHLRGAVYCTAAARGANNYWDFLLERARADTSRDEARALAALACARSPPHLLQALELTLNEDFEVLQHMDILYQQILRSPMGLLIGKNFIYTRIDEINKKYNSVVRRVFPVRVLVEQLTTKQELDEFLDWHNDRLPGLHASEKVAIEQGIRRARMNIEWHARHKRLVVRELRRLALPRTDHELTQPKSVWQDFTNEMTTEEQNTSALQHKLVDTYASKQSKPGCSPSFIYLLVARISCLFI